MFNGSKQYGPREFDRVMESNGGSNNAYTTRDVTVYSDWFTKSALELMVSMEAERLNHLVFDPAVDRVGTQRSACGDARQRGE